MANETNTTTLTNLINSELIDPLIADYAIDATVLAPAVRQRSIAGLATKTATFEKWSKNSAGTINELSAPSNAALTTTEVQVAVSKVGIRRQVSIEAFYTTIAGSNTPYEGGSPGALEMKIADDAGALIGENLETTLWALFTSATSSVSHSGLPFSVAYLIEALAKQRVAKAPAPWSFFFATKASEHLQQSLAASGGALFGNPNVDTQSILKQSADGELGTVFAMDAYYSNLNTTANAGVDVVSACITDGRGGPRAYKQCPIGLVMLWAFQTFIVPDPTVSWIYILHACFGGGLINTDTITKIISSAT